MSQWDKIISLELYNVIREFYTPRFPIEVRGAIASFLEEHVFLAGIDPNRLDHIPYMHAFLNKMLEELQTYIDRLTGKDNQTIFFRQTLSSQAAFIKHTYQNDPASLYHIIKNCIEQEQQYLQVMNTAALGGTNQQLSTYQPSANSFIALKDRLSFLKPNLERLKRIVSRMPELIRDIGNIRDEGIRIQDLGVMGQNGNTQDPLLIEKMNNIRKRHEIRKQDFRNELLLVLTGMKAVLSELKQTCTILLEMLETWKIEKRKSANGFPMSTNLDNIEELAKIIATTLLEIYHQLGEADQYQANEEITNTDPQFRLGTAGDFQVLYSEVANLLQSLVTNTWVVDRQPNQVLATKASKITPVNPDMKLRLLVGGVLNENASCTVNVAFVNETEVEKAQRDPNYVPKSPVQLQNSKKIMRFDKDSKMFSVEFKGIQIKEMPSRTKGKKGSGSPDSKKPFVVEERWYFFFSTDFSALGSTFKLQTTSCQVTVTVNPSQDPHAWGAIVWDNAFPDDKRNRVNCEELLNHWDKKFLSVTGRGFNSTNRKMIRQKLLRNESESIDELVSWEAYYTLPLEGIQHPVTKKSVSFCEWLFAIMKLCKKSENPKKLQENQHFQKYWEDGKILGFITRDEMNDVLQHPNSNGTFLFRFSDTILGSVTLICNRDGIIQKYEPYTLGCLKAVPLPDRVLAKSHLQNLYPGNIFKTTAFSQTPDKGQNKLLEGYIRTIMCEKELVDPTVHVRHNSIASTSSITWDLQSPYCTVSTVSPNYGDWSDSQTSQPNSAENQPILEFDMDLESMESIFP